jgi:AraC-like DNA-binding protein
MISNGHLVLREACIPAGTEWKTKLQGWVFLLIASGDGFLLRQSSALMLGAGDMLVAGSPALCPLRSSQLGELRMNYFLLQPESLGGVLTPFERQYLKANGNHARLAVRHFPPNHSHAKQFAALCAQEVGDNGLMTRCQILHLAATVLREELPKQQVPIESSRTARERFEQLMKQIPEEELQHLSPADLAQMCGCSVRHVSRQFRSYFGHSFVPKRTELRLQKARQLLAETDAKVIDVAFESGFQHVGLFTAAFKKHFRFTPSEWRARQRKQPPA